MYSEDDLQAMFARFVAKYKRNYGESLAVYKRKYSIFKDNVALAAKKNAASDSQTFGITVRCTFSMLLTEI